MSAGELRVMRTIVLGLQNRAQRQFEEAYQIVEGLATLASLLDELLKISPIDLGHEEEGREP